MAVHLHARLNTRFIPILFSLAIAASLIVSVLHAEERKPVAAVDTGTVAAATAREQLRELIRTSNEARADRRPGFSRITYAPEAPGGARAAIAAQFAAFVTRATPPKSEGPAATDAASPSSDRIPAQPSEAEPISN